MREELQLQTADHLRWRQDDEREQPQHRGRYHPDSNNNQHHANQDEEARGRYGGYYEQNHLDRQAAHCGLGAVHRRERSVSHQMVKSINNHKERLQDTRDRHRQAEQAQASRRHDVQAGKPVKRRDTSYQHDTSSQGSAVHQEQKPPSTQKPQASKITVTCYLTQT